MRLYIDMLLLLSMLFVVVVGGGVGVSTHPGISGRG